MPIWKDETLVADEAIDYGYGEAEARRFVDTLADVLGVDRQHAIPAYEDVWYYLWKERRLPANVDPLSSKLEDEEERERLSRIFEQGPGAIVGYALPLQRRSRSRPGAPWTSGPWFFRSERMFLLPGDSPIGYRLPLDSLPWVAPGEYPHLYETDPVRAVAAVAEAAVCAKRHRHAVTRPGSSNEVASSSSRGRDAASRRRT